MSGPLVRPSPTGRDLPRKGVQSISHHETAGDHSGAQSRFPEVSDVVKSTREPKGSSRPVAGLPLTREEIYAAPSQSL